MPPCDLHLLLGNLLRVHCDHTGVDPTPLGHLLLMTAFEVPRETVHPPRSLHHSSFTVRGVSWSEVATVPKRKSHRGLDLDLSLNSEVNITKGWKENGGTK